MAIATVWYHSTTSQSRIQISPAMAQLLQINIGTRARVHTHTHIHSRTPTRQLFLLQLSNYVLLCCMAAPMFFFPIHVIQLNHPFSHNKSRQKRTSLDSNLTACDNVSSSQNCRRFIIVRGDTNNWFGVSAKVARNGPSSVLRHCRQLFMQTCCHTFIISCAHVVENRTSCMVSANLSHSDRTADIRLFGPFQNMLFPTLHLRFQYARTHKALGFSLRFCL